MPARRCPPTVQLISLLPLLLGTAAVAATSPSARADAELSQVDAALSDRHCLEALFQLELLVGKYKVFKPGPGDTRTYLDDPDRPAEIARLARVRDEACSHEQPLQGSQKRRAAELFQALSADCREAREKLARMAQPDSRSSRNEIERHREWMARYCPDVPDADTHTDVWLADRVWQWHTR